MTKNTYRLLLAANLSTIAIALTACPSNPAPTDSGPPPSDSPTPTDDVPSPTDDVPSVITNDCTGYCTVVMASCTGADAQWGSMADCMQYCADAGWPAGTEGATSGNTIACRIYHGGVAGMAGMAGTHCPHAGPSGGGVCGTVAFSTGAGTRVDRMGMPAVSTALVPSANKNAYNDGSPPDDEAGTFVPFLGTGLAALHTALDDDLTGAGLTPCSFAPIPPATLPECFAQEIAPGVPAAALVVPDALGIDPTLPAGFPNGRQLDDAVIDPILAVILLRLGATCGAAPCGLATLAGTNPVANDEVFSTTFPYLADPHAP